MTPESSGIEPQAHYPYVTRSLLRLYENGALTNVDNIDVEPAYGYVARITYADGSHRITYGNDLGLNAAAPSNLAKDKGHSKFMLRTIGVNCPAGEEFLMPWWAERMSASSRYAGKDDIKDIQQAPAYIEENFGYPVYVKPVKGSKGGNIYKVHDSEHLAGVIEVYEEKKIRLAMVEEPVDMPDYRIVILDGDLISAYRRDALRVTGDGTSTIRELVIKKAELFAQEERDTHLDPDDPAITHYLASKGLSQEAIPSNEEELVLSAISNLSAGGTSVDVTESINTRWTELSGYIAENFSLRLCGVDLSCADITSQEADYSVLEVNASPGLDHYAMSGEAQRQLVDLFYTQIFDALPSSR